MNNDEPIFGYSVQDIGQLEVEIDELKRKRNTSIIIGSIIGGIAIITMIVLLVLFIKECDAALTARDTSGLRQKEALYKIGLSLLGLVGSAGEAIAVAGGISNGVKAKRRQTIVKRLKQIKKEMAEEE